ncbi:MAG TPA: hypothetical protein VN451_08115 [Chitinophagaceae bacterium]|nr:hypothetical protein [Chitinophagaceae bacterium]
MQQHRQALALWGLLRKMKHRLFVVILSILIGYDAFSQLDSTHIARNLIYVEAAGIGGYGSVNYERVLLVRNYLMFAVRFGLSTNHIKDYTNEFNPDILVLLALNGYYGKSHKIEWGVGETFSNIVYADLTEFKPKRITNFHTNFNVGYRYQKNTGGIIFRCTYTPIIEFNRYYRHWAGISFGYTFKKRR